MERARKDHLFSARPWVGLNTSERTLTIHCLSANGLDTLRAKRPTRGRHPKSGTRSKRSPLIGPPMGWTQNLRQNADPPFPIRPWVGHASRQAPNPRAAPQECTSSQPAHGLDSTPQRESWSSFALSAHGLDTRRDKRPTRGRRPRGGKRSKRSPLLGPPMGWTRGALCVQPMGGAPRLARTQVSKMDRIISPRPWVGHAGAPCPTHGRRARARGRPTRRPARPRWERLQ